jgi:hypothetical protein
VAQQASMRGREWAAELLVLLVACTPPHSQPPSTQPASQPHTLATRPCPVTQPIPRGQVPSAVARAVFPGVEDPDVGDWYGNDALWVELYPHGTVVKGPSEELSEKFPWVRLIRGRLHIDGRRLDGPAPPPDAQVPTGYGPSGFQASGISFPTVGCWEITGKISDRELTFVVEVRRRSG